MSSALSVTTKQGKRKFNGKMKEKNGTGFVVSSSDHDLFILYIEGKKQLAYAKFSKASSGKNSYVHSQTPKQLGIGRKFCENLIKCNHTLGEYLEEWDVDLVKIARNLSK